MEAPKPKPKKGRPPKPKVKVDVPAPIGKNESLVFDELLRDGWIPAVPKRTSRLKAIDSLVRKGIGRREGDKVVLTVHGRMVAIKGVKKKPQPLIRGERVTDGQRTGVISNVVKALGFSFLQVQWDDGRVQDYKRDQYDQLKRAVIKDA